MKLPGRPGSADCDLRHLYLRQPFLLAGIQGLLQRFQCNRADQKADRRIFLAHRPDNIPHPAFAAPDKNSIRYRQILFVKDIRRRPRYNRQVINPKAPPVLFDQIQRLRRVFNGINPNQRRKPRSSMPTDPVPAPTS